MFPRFVIANHTAVINYVSVAFCVSVVVFAQASITKYHRLGGLNNRNFFLIVQEAGILRVSGWLAYMLLA